MARHPATDTHSAAIAAQSAFRAALEAISRPGKIVDIPTVPARVGAASPAALALILALADGDTPVWLDAPARDGELADHLRFHCGCPVVDDPGRGAFALITDAAQAPLLHAFDPGTPEYPDRSATVILQVACLTSDAGVCLTGPGIETVAGLNAAPLPAGFWDQFVANGAGFPLGVDIFLVEGGRIAALPRSVSVEA